MPTTTITCPFCGQSFDVALDDTEGEQNVTTDCEVCCRPIEVRAVVDGGDVEWVKEG